jgi:diguanylate cyclase (GGDEF)-like protein/PAS domain S-box-containing protein
VRIPDSKTPGEHKQGGSRPSTWLKHHLGFDSIRGRYLLVAGFFVSFVLVAGWAAQRVVDQSSQQSTFNTTERKTISHLLNDLNEDIWLTETALQGYLLTPEVQQRVATLGSLDHLIADTQTLAATEWVQHSYSRRELLNRFLKDTQELRQQSARLMDIRTDAERLFPAMRLMLEKMLPNHTTFLSQATLAMEEANERRDRPRQQEVHRLFAEARYAWAIMVGNFRVFVANRFGIFPGDPESGMKVQHQQIEFYHEMVDRNLRALAQLEAQKALEFQQSESLANMRRINKEWYQAYLAAAAIYSSERWRADVPLLRDTIRPLFAQLWTNMGVLRGEIESATVTDMTSISGIADRLSGALWFISFITIALTAAGYLFFEYTVRRPIADVASALKAEARGENALPMQRTATAETGDLIEAFQHMRAQVHTRQERLQTILDNTAEGIITFDAHGIVESYNQAAMRLFGWTEQEVVGQNIAVLVQRDVQAAPESYLARLLRNDVNTLIGQEGEVMGQRQGGDNFHMAIKISAMRLDDKQMFTALVADISERRAMVEHLRALAEHDDLTGLYNRSFFLQEIERVVDRTQRTRQVSTLLYIDLDNFKYVNDTLGHLAGDRLLIEVSQLLRNRARRSDLVARLGGDEFTMLLYDTRAEEAQTIAESFRKALVDYRFRQASEQVDVGCSIGVAMINTESRSAEEVLSRADFACHLAKRDGRNRVHVFDVRDEANVTALSLDMGWSRRIKDAIEHNQFILVGQPIVDTHNRQTSAHEILIRLRDEHGALIMPNGFLPAAERFGLSADIDRWVIVNAIRMLAERRRELPTLRYSLNLSGQTLSEPAICDLVILELRRTGLDPSALTFEVTETVAIANMALAETFLARLQQIGCSTALDDFGAGMSSFAYLRELPVDYVKIDGRFVRNLATNPTDQAMVRAMNDIAHALGKKTIAEFVEDEDCYRLLCEYGVDYAQGFHLGRPEAIYTAVDNCSDTDTEKRVVYLKPR